MTDDGDETAVDLAIRQMKHRVSNSLVPLLLFHSAVIVSNKVAEDFITNHHPSSEEYSWNPLCNTLRYIFK